MLIEVHIDIQLGLELLVHLLCVHVLEGALLVLRGRVVFHQDCFWIFKVIIHQYFVV